MENDINAIIARNESKEMASYHPALIDSAMADLDNFDEIMKLRHCHEIYNEGYYGFKG